MLASHYHPKYLCIPQWTVHLVEETRDKMEKQELPVQLFLRHSKHVIVCYWNKITILSSNQPDRFGYWDNIHIIRKNDPKFPIVTMAGDKGWCRTLNLLAFFRILFWIVNCEIITEVTATWLYVFHLDRRFIIWEANSSVHKLQYLENKHTYKTHNHIKLTKDTITEL